MIYETNNGVLEESLLLAFRPAVLRGLMLLLQAHEYVKELGHDRWGFAIEIDSLVSAGMTRSDLRWLLCRRLVEQATEITTPNDPVRAFEPACNLQFNERTCFVLTPAGLSFAGRNVGNVGRASAFATPRPVVPQKVPIRLGVPVWDQDRQELRLDDVLIKRFKAPAPNQEAVLCAFEEEGWPARIDDPIPPLHDQEPKRRLHDTINALNRNHRRPALRFLGDGSGLGVRWELVPSIAPPRWEMTGKPAL
jgi:hypothetical protein